MPLFKNLTDRFIPDEIKADGHSKILRKSRLLIKLVPVTFIMMTTNAVISFLTTDKFPTIYVVGLFVIACIPLILKYRKSYYLAASIMPLGSLVLVPWAMATEGGIYSFPVVWAMIGPVISVFFLGTKGGTALSMLSIMEIAAFVELHQNGHSFPHPLDMSSDHGHIGLGIISMIFFTTFLSFLNESIRSKFEENLKKSQEKALSAIKAKDIFWANISHEIRTPMNGILGMTNLLLSSRLNKEQKELMEIIKDCGESLNIIINDVLDYSKIESGELAIEKHPFNLARCIDSVFAIFKHMADQKGLKLEYSIDSDVPTGILTDEYRLRQVLVNLLGNAIKFTEHGKIYLLVETTGKINELKFNVKDTGIGIPVDKADRLFRPFSQIDDSTARRYGGSGLGLVICKKLAHLLGGDIGFESEKNVGSIFWFTLTAMPVKIRKESDVKDTDGEFVMPYITRKRELKVLVAEDNVINQKLIHSLLNRMGYHADSAHNGLEVLKLMKEKKYDIVLMDVQMPEMDGITATKRINHLFPDNKPVIVAVTANVLQEDKDRCYEAGMDEFMAKPINPAVLEELLDRYAKKFADPKDIDKEIDRALEVIPDPIELSKEVAKKVVRIISRESEFNYIDSESILTNFSEDMEIIRVIIDQFSMKAPMYISEIQEAITTEDYINLEASCHTLKGTVSNFFCKDVTAKIISLEKMGKNENMAGADELLTDLKAEIEMMIEELYILYDSGSSDDNAA